MCGIVGYVGDKQAAPIVLECLSKLEYRGYDSAGIAIFDGKNINIEKAVGKLVNLSEKTNNGENLKGTLGIGHTRWATHGSPTELNAHPHISCNNISEIGTVNVVGVHNGIIENYKELKEKLLAHGYKFYSDTDTEVVIKLVDYYYNKYKLGPIDAIAKTMVRSKGSYALELIFKDHPGEIWVAKKDSPLVVGVEDNESFIGSDVPAFIKHTRNVYYLKDLEFGCVKAGEVKFYNLNGDEVSKTPTEITWDVDAAEKGGYDHFMIKEIHEQPKLIRDTFNSLVKDNKIDLSDVGITVEEMKNFNQIYIIGCGSAYHAGLVGQYLFEGLTRTPIRMELASEFRYRNPIIDDKCLVISVSQSGETADTLAAIKLAKQKGAKTLSIVNVVGSSIARESDHTIYTLAGPEISVATTKAYSCQVIVLYLLAIYMGEAKGMISKQDYDRYLTEINTIPEKIEKILQVTTRIQWLASSMSVKHHAFFIGRGVDYATCLEGSLKLKEVSYLHSEAYAAGELKHGTISLIDEQTPVIAVSTQSALNEKIVSNIVETKSRGAFIIGVGSSENDLLKNVADIYLEVPAIDELFMPSLSIVPLQLLGYYVSVAKGLDVDKPRNLAKSVTVE